MPGGSDVSSRGNGATSGGAQRVRIGDEEALIASSGDLAIALDVLHGQHDRAVLEQLGDNVRTLLHDPVSLRMILKSLSPDDQAHLIQSLGGELPAILREASSLRDILAFLSVVEVEEQLLHAIGAAGLRRLIQSADELAEVVEWCYGEVDELLLDLLGPQHLRWLCRTGAGISAILRSLSGPLQEHFVEAVGWETIEGCVRDGRDLALLMRALPPQLSSDLVDRYDVGALVHLIGNPTDWRYLRERLEAGEAEHLFDRLKEVLDAP
jgi:hypothetical protein